MTGDHITEPLDYLYEELSPESMAEARRHLASCPDCRREMRAIRETVKLYREVPRPTAPDGLADRAAAAALAGLARPAAALAAPKPATAPADSVVTGAPATVPAPTVPDTPATPAAATGSGVAANPAVSVASAASTGGTVPVPVLYPPPPRTPLPYPDMEKEFARLKEEVMRDAPKGLRSWLFHPAWTVAASVIFLCALLMHLSPRMQAERTIVIPAAPTRSAEAARQIRLRERIPPSEPRSASSLPAGEPPPILSEAEAVNSLDLEHLLADEDEPPRGKFTVTRVNPTALLDDTPPEAFSSKKMEITATPGGWVASGTGAENRDAALAPVPPASAAPAADGLRQPAGTSVNGAARIPASAPALTASPSAAAPSDSVRAASGTAARDGSRFSAASPAPAAVAETGPAAPKPRRAQTAAASTSADTGVDSSAPVETGAEHASGQAALTPPPVRPESGGAIAAPSQTSTSSPTSLSAPADGVGGTGRSGGMVAGVSADSGEEGPVVSQPLAADDDVAFDGLIVDWEDRDNPPQIVPRPTPLDVPERIRVLTALAGMQIAHREWDDAWRTVALVEAYDKTAAANLRSLVRTAQDAAADEAQSGAADGESRADTPGARAGGSDATGEASAPEAPPAPSPGTTVPGDGADDRRGDGHPLRPSPVPSGAADNQSGPAHSSNSSDPFKSSGSSGSGSGAVGTESAASTPASPV